MIFKNTVFYPQNRRGLSSVVGALFFTVLMIAGFSVLSLALDAQTDIVTTQRIVSDIEIKKQQETFGVFASTDANDILNLSISNQGQNPVEISSLWITNKTLPDQPTKRYTVNYDDAFVPSNFITNIVSTQTLKMIPDTYDIKIISALGTIKTVEMDNNGGGASDLRVELFTDPPDPVIGKNVTVALMVTNTGLVDTISNVQPFNFGVSAPGSVNMIPDPLTNPPHIPAFANLNPGASVMFTWDFKVNGDSGDVLTFSSSAIGNGVGSTNTAKDTSQLRIAGEGGGTPDPDIVNDDLFARPQLFFVIPSSHGQSDSATSLWGVNVVNPVNAPMDVTKLIITAFAPGAQNNNKIFDMGGGANCSPVPSSVYPGTGTWSCPSENALMWKSSVPVTIPANSTQAFLAQVEPGKPSGNVGLESITVQGSVFTSLGSFGKAGYQSTMSETATPIVNVFLAKDLLGSDHRDSNNIDSTRINISPNSLETFHVVFADMDGASTEIASGAKLIINVPKKWTDVDVTGWNGFPVEPSISPFGDGSHQIVGTTNANFGDTTPANSVRTITFEARAPTLPVGSDELYVMYVLAQGDTTNGFSIGPLAEIVLQVDG
jgi:hypothetical protein